MFSAMKKKIPKCDTVLCRVYGKELNAYNDFNSLIGMSIELNFMNVQ